MAKTRIDMDTTYKGISSFCVPTLVSSCEICGHVPAFGTAWRRA